VGRDGAALVTEFTTEREAVRYLATRAGEGLRFHDLRHSYATWLVDDGVPVNMVQRVMGHERSSTTLDLYTRRTDDEERILRAWGTTTMFADYLLTLSGDAAPDRGVCAGGRYWDRTSDLSGVNGALSR
jgi:hypothetical protein